MGSWNSVSIPGIHGAHQLNHGLGFSDCKTMASIFALDIYLNEFS